jgi:hypothetical protein
LKDGRFEIPGCDPGRPSTFYFLFPIDERRHHSGPDGRMTMFNLILLQDAPPRDGDPGHTQDPAPGAPAPYV